MGKIGGWGSEKTSLYLSDLTQMDGPLSNPEDPPGDGDTGLLDLPEVSSHPTSEK